MNGSHFANPGASNATRTATPRWKRRPRQDDGVSGFTIIELLIVIVIIAILAAITIVAYNGITQKAEVATLQSDLSNGYDVLGAAQATAGTGQYPASQSSAGLKSSPGVTLGYNPTGSYDANGNYTPNGAYCLQGVYNGLVYAVSSNNNVPTQGYCSWGRVIPGAGDTYLNSPEGITFGSSGNLYVADSNNNCIRQVPPSGVLNSFAGICGSSGGTSDGTGAATQFAYPDGLAIDSSGNLYVADSVNECIRKITPSAVVTTFAGTCNPSYPGSRGSANGTGPAAQFDYPAGIALDSSGNLYVADEDNNCIREITPSAVVTTFAGTCNPSYPGSQGFANGTGSAAQFNYPVGLAFNSSGDLYVADGNNNCIREITPSAVVTTFAGTCDPSGNSAGSANGTGPAAQFNYPVGLAFDSSGNLYVADSDNACIRKITPSAVVTTFAGTCAGGSGVANGTGPAAQFFDPEFLTLDSSGNLYVSEGNGDCIRKITPAAVVTTFAGTCSGGSFAG